MVLEAGEIWSRQLERGSQVRWFRCLFQLPEVTVAFSLGTLPVACVLAAAVGLAGVLDLADPVFVVSDYRLVSPLPCALNSLREISASRGVRGAAESAGPSCSPPPFSLSSPLFPTASLKEQAFRRAPGRHRAAQPRLQWHGPASGPGGEACCAHGLAFAGQAGRFSSPCPTFGSRFRLAFLLRNRPLQPRPLQIRALPEAASPGGARAARRRRAGIIGLRPHTQLSLFLIGQCFLSVIANDACFPVAAELRAYLKSKGAEISEENSEGGLHVDLAQIVEACDGCLKEDDKDVESVMNSVVSLLLILEPDKQEALIESLCEKLVKFREGERPSLRLQLLSNLFHGMDKNTPVRYVVYCSLVRVAASCGAIQYVPTELDQVRKWISDWNLTTEKKHTLLRLLYEALVDCKKSDAASKVMVELLGSYTEDNASQARVDAHRCIVRALKDPNAFLFDHLLTLKPVKFLEGELIHDLLTIFVSAKLASYVKFYQNNKDFIDSLGLLHEQNMAKMRLLTFMGMAVENKEISFDTMQQELQIGADDVEAFVIDAVRTKMVYCKIDQTQRKVVVSHSTHRTFGKQQWQQLYDTLNAWKQNLNKVKNSLLSLSDT
ncbi:eukaryotic translation initiation factor 3 subunit M [Octodon degus]|uniref:Eukaryotic translation initiation factor 3 subunit M n=5 Tax=Boreoeutheria TaxID=1437010 RepID=A0A6P6F371_OCTDE|nr:eukaryotic translation initiation factor 3 subunit M [Octodon degus]